VATSIAFSVGCRRIALVCIQSACRPVAPFRLFEHSSCPEL
jgi:hypothetical protein